MLSCRAVSRLIASDEFERAPWGRRMSIRLHLLMCRHCRLYAKQLRAIGAYAGKHWGSQAKDSATLQRLERTILERISEHPEGSTEADKRQIPPAKDSSNSDKQ